MGSTYTVAGMMSGTSLDGLDIAICRFEEVSGRWTFTIEQAHTFIYDDEWKTRLENAMYATGEELALLHADFGRYMGECARKFFMMKNIQPLLVCSHGHTIFHQPSSGFTFQAGCGAAIAAECGIDTVSDFRSMDVALGGQGAPLVPIGDHHLFGGHRYCLNLGGFANISFEKDEQRIAFDICPVNMAMNYLAMKSGVPFDRDGEMSMNGNVIEPLLEKLNNLGFYKTSPPKSLGREWFEREFQPLIDNDEYSVNDRLRTVVQHAGEQVASALTLSPGTTMLTTGGGAYHNLLIEVIEEQVSRHGIHVVVPDPEIIEYKEALIFAFLGLLRVLKRDNALASVTGAGSNSVGGAVYAGRNAGPQP